MNDVRLPFTEVLVDFKNVLTGSENFHFKNQDIKINGHCLQFQLKDETIPGLLVDFDLLAATNMVPIGQKCQPTWKIQQEEMLKYIASLNKKKQEAAAKANSTGLIEAAVAFMKGQSTFAHKVCQ